MSTGAFKLTDIDVPTKGRFSVSDVDKESGFSLPHSWKEVWSRLSQTLPRPAGGGEEATLAKGAPPAAAGLSMIGTAGMGVGAVATRSLAPLYPLARGILGAAAGKYVGREAGGLVGQPELGGDVGALAGGAYAAGGGKIPTKADVMEFFNKPEFQETGAPLPSAEEFYANHGKEIMTAMKQQPEAFGVPAPPAGAPLPSVEKFYEMRGREIMAAIKQQPEAFGFAKGEKGQLVPTPSKIVSPLSPPPPINRTLVSYDRNLLVHMARGGDLDALRELVRNPGDIDVATAVPNSKYLLEANAPTNIYGGPK